MKFAILDGKQSYLFYTIDGFGLKFSIIHKLFIIITNKYG